MTDTLDTKVKLDTGEAVKDAKLLREEYKRLGEAEEFVAKAQGEMAKEAQKARDQLLNIRRAAHEGTAGSRDLARETRAVNLRMAELREASRGLTTEQKRLRDEQKRVRTEMKESAQAARELARAEREVAQAARAAEQATARAEAQAARLATREQANAARSAARGAAEAARNRAATARAQGRSESLAVRGRSLHAEDIASARRINELEGSISELDRRNFRLTGRAFGGVRTRVEDFAGDSQRVNEAGNRQIGRFAAGVPGVARMAAGAGVAALGAGATMVGGIASAGGQFEQLRTSLETIEGSSGKAKASFDLIRKFAKETPYELSQVTDAFIKLKARGLDASQRSLTAYGDTASAMGKSLDQMIEAVGDATTFQFERLKEFGIQANVQGDKVKFTFKGVSTTVAKDSKEIEKYLLELGETNFGGGMVKQSKTMAGQLSNLSDTVAQLADGAFTHGLGDALKDVVADMTDTIGGGENLAQTIGETLGQAVRDTYAWVKEFIGPVDELPGKFRSVVEGAKEVVSGLGRIVNIGKSIVETIGPANTLMLGFGVALTAMTGPLGAVATAGFLTGQALGKYAYEVTHADERTKTFFANLKSIKAQVELEVAKQKYEALEKEIDEHNAMTGRIGAAQDKVTQETLRRYGVDDVMQLPADARRKLNLYTSKIDADTIESIEKDALSAFTAKADRGEFERLKAKRKNGKLAPSEQKRLSALSTALDEPLPAGGGKKKKADLTEFEDERKREIDKRVKEAEVEAADASILAGQGGDAAIVAARAAGKSTRKNLEEMARKGVLPGDVERAALRAAGYEDVTHAPPPPIIVYDQKFYNQFTMPTEIKATLTGDPATAAGQLVQQIKFVFETIIVPEAARGYATAMKR